jgi:hypothetical protein
MAHTRIAAFGALTLLSLVGCRTGSGKADTAVLACDAPVAEAGADLTATLGGPVTLDAGASSFCESRADGVSYEWSFEAVPTDSTIDTSALSDNLTISAVQPVFTPDVVGDYTLGLVVSDGVDASDMNYVVVSVVSGDQKPVADCGMDVETMVSVAASLDGSASYDPEGAELEYIWSLSDLPDCSDLDSSSIYNSAGPTPSVVPDCEGVYTVTLVVSDSINYSDPSICTVEADGVNDRPFASAGPSVSLGACADDPMPLDGTGSYDPEDDALTYAWSLYAAPSASTTTDANFDDPTLPSPSFDWDVPGAYTFQLQVNDGELDSAPDLVTVTIGETVDNRAPIANAGESQEIAETSDCSSSSYVWTCDDCSAVDVEFDGSSSRDPDGDSLSYTWSETTGSIVFSARYSAITDATIPAQAASYGTANSITFDVNLEVADCEASDSDSVQVLYSCTGEAP